MIAREDESVGDAPAVAGHSPRDIRDDAALHFSPRLARRVAAAASRLAVSRGCLASAAPMPRLVSFKETLIGEVGGARRRRSVERSTHELDLHEMLSVFHFPSTHT
jgi:hypothetical protein